MGLFSLPRAENKKDQAPHHEEKKQKLGGSSGRDGDSAKSNQCDW
jgi:hypothetical protein